jgi:DNA-binding NtrC family response regulator
MGDGGKAFRPRILVVDDAPETREFLERVLRKEYDVVAVTRPGDAVARLMTDAFDAVIADQSLREGTGVDLLEKAARLAPQTVRILISGYADPRTLADAINRAAVSHFIEKPLNVRAVREAVRGAAPRRQRDHSRVMIVASAEDASATLAATLGKAGLDVVPVGTAAEAADTMVDADPDVLVVDLDVGTEAAAAIVTTTLRQKRPVPVILIADNERMEEAMALVRLGALDVVLKPFRTAELVLRVTRAGERRRMFSEVIDLRRSQERFAYRELVGGSEPMRVVYETIERVADTDATVMIRGETGTGKELVARILHQVSGRRQGPFVPIHCAAVPEGLIESELFGHEKGAFTGATARRIGRFEQASRGTIFLDEVGDIPPAVQVKLLRVLQERLVERVGGREPIQVDVRVLAATNADLEHEVKTGRFRQDLYYRLNVVPIHVPPLRERTGDIPHLVGHFLEAVEARLGKRNVMLSPEAVAALERYAWPGNVRELMNVLERAVALTPTGGTIGREGLFFAEAAPPPVALAAAATATPDASVGIRSAVEQLERAMIVEAMQRHGGNQTRAAAQLGITRQALAQKLAKYGIR